MDVLIAESHHANSNANDASADETNKRVDIKTLLTRSDVVSLHCPLTQNNQHMIAANEFSIMKKVRSLLTPRVVV